MGFRFRKSFGKGPFRVTVSKSGVGYSVGGKGFRYTKKAGGGTRTTASIPGTGISYVKDSGSKAKTTQQTAAKPIASIPAPASHFVSEPDTISAVPASSSVLSRHKYCTKCKKEIPLDAKTCPHCGKRWGAGTPGVPSRIWFLIPAALVAFAIILAWPVAQEPPTPTQPPIEVWTEATTEPTKSTVKVATESTMSAADPFAGQGAADAVKTYVLNTDTHKFHHPSCEDVDDIDPSNKESYTGIRNDVINQGYEPCGHCDP